MGRHDGDVDILAKIVKEAEEALEGEIFKVTAEKQGDFRLTDFEDFSCLGLGKLLLFDDSLNFVTIKKKGYQSCQLNELRIRLPRRSRK